eukprot:scaffold126_cov178-Amphora_coffeaeformis.AAC.6
MMLLPVKAKAGGTNKDTTSMRTQGWTQMLSILALLATGASAFSVQHSTTRSIPRQMPWSNEVPRTSPFVLPNSNPSGQRRPCALHMSASSSSSSSPPSNSGLSSSASSAADLTTSPNGADVSTSASSKIPFYKVLWKFSRPHTIIGSALAIPSLHLLASPTLAIALSVPNLVACVAAMIPACLMNLYITGLNQITDVEIDKVNKPYLPIAAGLLTMKDAIVTVVLALVASLAMGLSYGTQGLNVALWGSAVLGTIYSLEPFRFKRFPVLAAFCIVAVRGAIINASFYAHAKASVLGSPVATVLGCLATDRACFLSSLFFGVFGLVIALMKDVPDVVGDRLANVKTFSVRLGQAQVFTGMRRLLSGLFWAVSAAFVNQAVRAFSNSSMGLAACRLVTAAASAWAGWSVRQESQSVNPEDSDQVYSYYMHLWKLFYMSYLVLPFAR